jgi:hypothetical protein
MSLPATGKSAETGFPEQVGGPAGGAGIRQPTRIGSLFAGQKTG